MAKGGGFTASKGCDAEVSPERGELRKSALKGESTNLADFPSRSNANSQWGINWKRQTIGEG